MKGSSYLVWPPSLGRIRWSTVKLKLSIEGPWRCSWEAFVALSNACLFSTFTLPILSNLNTNMLLRYFSTYCWKRDISTWTWYLRLHLKGENLSLHTLSHTMCDAVEASLWRGPLGKRHAVCSVYTSQASRTRFVFSLLCVFTDSVKWLMLNNQELKARDTDERNPSPCIAWWWDPKVILFDLLKSWVSARSHSRT